MRRALADAIDGVLVLDKPAGLSSNAALQRARMLLRARKAGHTGTLDPLASGVLPIAFGNATKFAAGLLDADKAYEARIELGATTASGDAEGPVLERRPVDVTQERFEQALGRFMGRILQVPPMHSALKRGGRPLYELARQGREVERAARPVLVSGLRLLAWDARRPLVGVQCGKGTYVRVLAQDIGALLGCGAHLAALRRTRAGELTLERAVTLDELEALDLEQRRARLLAADAMLEGLARVALDAQAATRFGHGQRLCWSAAPARVRVYDERGALLGVARCDGAWLEPLRLVAQPAGARAVRPAAPDERLPAGEAA